jgi:hypothetical protein
MAATMLSMSLARPAVARRVAVPQKVRAGAAPRHAAAPPPPPRAGQGAPRAALRASRVVAPLLTPQPGPTLKKQAAIAAGRVRAVRSAVILRSAATDSIIESMKKLTVRARPIGAAARRTLIRVGPPLRLAAGAPSRLFAPPFRGSRTLTASRVVARRACCLRLAGLPCAGACACVVARSRFSPPCLLRSCWRPLSW